jgi:hypothetical protein
MDIPEYADYPWTRETLRTYPCTGFCQGGDRLNSVEGKYWVWDQSKQSFYCLICRKQDG